MLIIPEFSLPRLTKHQKTRFLRYAQQVLEAQQQMITPNGENIVHYALEKKTPQHMDHYPKGDRIDHDTGAQYFYHCHRENFETEEHGHFHCFLRYNRISKQIRPTSLVDWDKNIDNPMTHVVAIAINRYGQPIRLFSVNRWISHEIWYDAKHTLSFIKQFKMTKKDSSYWQLLDSWVEGMLHLFAPQIQWLNDARDIIISHYKTVYPDSNVYEDPRLDLLSEIPINLNKQIQWILDFELVKN
ncbi:DUF6969 family protein [Legionella maioricensis]|uniref:DUF6969 domain-containing protein n=1 Tax=Legionella maioricensis TaxID=2896528 RepID=A0A9X2D2J7_9GAMM|nr:hypothetical protein [Legionella maioricensis]MCL9685288.1 hypothetical protein [Legionella maioricensis]MCL9688543.1 hypothetical protein [Legionella maioricensis]